ncbi:MAG: ABC transporter ATP-binding protein, partial [Parvibaculaceae bacterium]|nr:ABC transporter ATP-binding protein [Parvibaculaceae bacterium]
MIETRDLTITLGDHCAVRDVSLKLNSGELVGLIGPNGAGKTTLMRALLRLTPIDKGEIFLDGKEITHDPAHAHAGQISYLPQGQNIAWPLTGKNLVAL